MAQFANLLLEIGAEELPASYVDAALTFLPEALEARLAQARLSHAGTRGFGTPRRLAVIVYDLLTSQPDLQENVVGPPVRVAFDAAGRPTKAAEAFARKLGCSVDKLERVETDKGVYLAGLRCEAGRPTLELLGPILRDLCAAIPFRKAMRWGSGEVTFGRPVRWLVAMLDTSVVDFEFAGLRSSNITYGHRFLAPEPIELADADEYEERLREAHVIADLGERRDEMLERLREACEGADATLIEDEFLVRENVNLVEEPHVVVGSFDRGFLELPEDVILAVARGHQRYFCARDADGSLRPIYLAVAGTAENVDNVRLGNDRVMRARLADARFFFQEDIKLPLESRHRQLAGIVFQDRLGTVLDKVHRVEALITGLGEQLGLSGADIDTARAGASLCKCDLASLMVGEFPELQGEMGATYARHQGQRDAVAEVIRGHYQPRGAWDATAPTPPAALVAVADRLDTLVGCFGIGLMPTGAADPYALRRACLGVLRTVLDRGWPLHLHAAVQASLRQFKAVKLSSEPALVEQRLAEFFRDRLRGLLVEQHPHDVVDACLAAGHDEPTDARARVDALAALSAPLRAKAGEVFKRATNIAREAPSGPPVNPDRLGGEAHESEKALFRALGSLDARLAEAQERKDPPAAFSAVADIAPLLAAFFDNVFVMTDNAAVRDNRLRLMRAISDRCSGLAHFNLLT